MTSPPKIAGTTTSAANREQDIAMAVSVAAALGIPFIERRGRRLGALVDMDRAGLIVVGNGRIGLHTLVNGQSESELYFHPGMASLRVQRLREGNSDHMIDALGLSRGDHAIDCTLGLGSDAIVMAYVLGPEGQVTGVEGSRVLAEIVKVGLRDYSDADTDVIEAMRRVTVVAMDHQSYLGSLPEKSADVLYFDPMFREPVRSSPGIRPLRAWAIERPLDMTTLELASRIARRRVVVKDRRGGGEICRLGLMRLAGGPKSSVEYGGIIMA